MASEDGGRPSGFAFTANHATIIVAIIGATAASFGNLYTAHENLLVAQQDLQAKLIFKAVEGSDLKERANNLHFLIEAGLLSDPDGKIRNLNDERYPSKSVASFNCVKDQTEAAQLICQKEELSVLDRIMARYYFRLLGLSEGKDKHDLVADQNQWLGERNSCLDLGGPADSCMAEKYQLRIAYLLGRLTEKQASAPHTAATVP
ncbi:MAG: hypothetical protein JOZ94_26030 [Xanthobacteraceae bacterium]|nr:hypothetical protein [Xanthobacteraceae bacterium]